MQKPNLYGFRLLPTSVHRDFGDRCGSAISLSNLEQSYDPYPKWLSSPKVVLLKEV